MKLKIFLFLMPCAESSRVFLVDDHPIIRDGFRELLTARDGQRVVGEAGSGKEALEKIEGSEVDLAIVDISMEEIGGIELTRRLKEEDPSLRVLIVSMHGETRYVEDALKAGASGYVLKDNVHKLLPEAVQEVLRGKRYLDPALTG